MQSVNEILEILAKDRPDVSIDEATVWANYLQQLKGCHLYSAASLEYDKEAWLKQRVAGIGGSEIATILGENHWSSPRQIWLEKIGFYDVESRPQSEQARWGNLLETTVAREWAHRNGRAWIHIPVILRSDDAYWQLANVDGFTLSDDLTTITGILEIKTTSEYNRQVWEEGPLPFNYICQTTWYCGITGLDQIELACLVGGQKLFDHTLPFDAELFEKEKAAAAKFWLENVLKGIEPEATEVDKQTTKKDDHDPSLPPVILDDDESERIVDAYCELRTKIGELTKVKDALYAQIYLKLGMSTQGLTKSHTIVLQTSARRSCDFDRLAEYYPQAYEECVSTNISTSLRIK